MGNSINCNCTNNIYTVNDEDSIVSYTTETKVKGSNKETKHFQDKKESLLIFENISVNIKEIISREEFGKHLNKTISEILAKKKEDLGINESAISHYLNPIKIGMEYYDGQWNVKGQRHGLGLFIDESSSVYYGEWEDDLKQGKGLYINLRGDYYIGGWEKGQMHGLGDLFISNGLTYMGEFKNSSRDGKGIEITDHYVYYGEFKDNLKEGYGFLKTNEMTYKGYFSKNNYDGHGLINWIDGKRYYGAIENSKITGHGITTWNNDSKYVGQYENGKKKGKGIYYWDKYKYYNGEWITNKPHGMGQYNSEINTFKGYWRFGKPIF
jgi:hypothetical protein